MEGNLYRKDIIDLGKEFLPYIYSRIHSNVWQILDDNLVDKITNIDLALKGKSIVSSEHNISTLLVEASKVDHDTIHKSFLKFIDDKLKFIFENINEKFHDELISMTERFLKECDTIVLNDVTPQYLNWLAEFLVLEKYLITNETTLIGIETMNENGKLMDLTIESEGVKKHIDVVTIHLRDRIAKNMDLLIKRVNDKIDSKIDSKKIKQLENHYILPILSFDKNYHINVQSAISEIKSSNKTQSPFYIGQISNNNFVDFYLKKVID